MNKTIKATLIVGAVLVCIGLVIVIVAGLVSNWKFQTLEWEYKEFTTSVDEEITDIDLQFNAGKLTVEYYKGNQIKIEYYESSEFTTKCYVSKGTLYIATTQTRWFTSFTWIKNIPETKMYIPQDMDKESNPMGLRLQVNAGAVSFNAGDFTTVDVELNAGTLTMNNLYCNSFEAEVNAGTLNMSHVETTSFDAEISAGALKANRVKSFDISLDVSAGSASLGVVGSEYEYSITTDVSAGTCNVKNKNGHTLKTLKVSVSAGSVNVTFDE